MSENLTLKETLHVADLARLALSEAELMAYTVSLSAILSYVDQLKSVDTTGIEPIGQVSGLTSVLQADEPAADQMADSIDHAAFLAGAPAAQSPYLKVKAVLE